MSTLSAFALAGAILLTATLETAANAQRSNPASIPSQDVGIPIPQPPSTESLAGTPALPSDHIKPAIGDILPDGQPDRKAKEHAVILRQIAIYASIGNREGVEILTAQARALGVSPGAIDKAAIWTNLHRSSPEQPSSGHSLRPIESGWEASQ